MIAPNSKKNMIEKKYIKRLSAVLDAIIPAMINPKPAIKEYIAGKINRIHTIKWASHRIDIAVISDSNPVIKINMIAKHLKPSEQILVCQIIEI